MHARTYSPVLGRFLQPDPARAEENLYAYAKSSPVTAVDPSGQFFCALPIIGWEVCVTVGEALAARTCGCSTGERDPSFGHRSARAGDSPGGRPIGPGPSVVDAGRT